MTLFWPNHITAARGCQERLAAHQLRSAEHVWLKLELFWPLRSPTVTKRKTLDKSGGLNVSIWISILYFLICEKKVLKILLRTYTHCWLIYLSSIHFFFFLLRLFLFELFVLKVLVCFVKDPFFLGVGRGGILTVSFFISATWIWATLDCFYTQ